MPEDKLTEVMKWCNDQIRDPAFAGMALEGLRNLLRHDDVRIKFYENDGLNRLGGLIKNAGADTQIAYQALFCLWLLSYNDDIAGNFHTTNVIQYIINCLKNIPKEKVIRIGTAVLAVSCFSSSLGHSWLMRWLEHHQQGRGEEKQPTDD
jgi:hypothetical protein